MSLALSYFVVTRPKNLIAGAVRGYARAAGAVPEYVIGIAFLFIFFATLHWCPRRRDGSTRC